MDPAFSLCDTAVPENLVLTNFFFLEVDSCHVKNVRYVRRLQGRIRPCFLDTREWRQRTVSYLGVREV